MKNFLLILFYISSAIVGLFIGIIGPRSFYLNAEFQRDFTSKIENLLEEGSQEIVLAPLFADVAGEYDEICVFVDTESSEPDSGEYFLKKHFQGRKIDLGYQDNKDYALAITLSSSKDIKIFPFREEYIHQDGKTYFFRGEQKNWGCVPFQKAVLYPKPYDRYPKQFRLLLKEKA